MQSSGRRHGMMRAVCLGLGGALGVVLLPGCGEPLIDARPGATSILDAFAGPSPEEAARQAIDPYSAENRLRGTLLLAQASFGGEAVYLRLFEDNARDEDAGVRAAAIRGLGRHGSPEQAGIMVAALEDPEPGVRLEAARSLQRVHAPGAVPALIGRLDPVRETSVDVRAASADALGQFAQPRVIDALVASLDDENLAVNVATRRSLRVLTGQDLGFERSAWAAWVRGREDVFAGRVAYEYPVFARDRRWFEYIPFVPPPPNEPRATPAGYLGAVGAGSGL